METSNLFAIFMTGLLTGGLTCMAVQGGLLASTIAQRQSDKLKEGIHDGHFFPILSFLFVKLVAYTVLGFLLGSLGSIFTLSVATQAALQFAVAVFMIGTALHILNVHPVFRYFAIQPPKFITRFIRNQSKSRDIFAPALLGAFTIFIPCATTQTMMALAIGSANPLYGAAILFSFILGTSPIFFILGYFANKLSDTFQKTFSKMAAMVILLVAIYNMNNAINLSGSTVNANSLLRDLSCSISFCEINAQPKTQVAVSEATITIDSTGYSPSFITVRAGSQVKLNLNNTDGNNCAQAFTIPKLNVQRLIRPGEQSSIDFTAPSTPGKIAFTCSMGMYSGTIDVI